VVCEYGDDRVCFSCFHLILFQDWSALDGPNDVIS
jgi:hypothetical protein